MKKILEFLAPVIIVFAVMFSAYTFGATTVPVQLLNPTGSSSGQAIVSTGAGSAPAWGGIGVNGIGSIAANTVLANATGSSASPTAYAMPSCSATGNALAYTSGTGFTCNTSLFSSPTITTPTITGITSGVNPSAPNLGQIIFSNVIGGSAVAMTSGVTNNITSITLPAGYWMLYGNVVTSPAGSTTTQGIFAGISTTSATLPTYPNGGAALSLSGIAISAGASEAFPVGVTIVNNSSTTTYFLVTLVNFSVSTMGVYGFIGAVRLH